MFARLTRSSRRVIFQAATSKRSCWRVRWSKIRTCWWSASRRGASTLARIEFIHNQIIKMRDAGKAILLVSVELDEIRSMSDRILVMFDGKIVGEADPLTATEGELGLMMAGVVGKPSKSAGTVKP